jgi:hypothetical protein
MPTKKKAARRTSALKKKAGARKPAKVAKFAAPQFHGRKEVRGLRLMEFERSTLDSFLGLLRPRFGRMFPGLPPHSADLGDLAGLGATMTTEAGAIPNGGFPAGFTYFGQFVDHDLTLDTTPLSGIESDPLAIRNFRTPAFDLDSVYRGGPVADPHLYEADGRTLKVGTSVNGDGGGPMINCGDLPREASGVALIGDARNDENLMVAQIHLVFLRFHNRVLQRLSDQGVADSALFATARRTCQLHYQWVVINDFLTRIADPGIVADVRNNGGTFYTPVGGIFPPFMPVEFAGAAYRFGHSVVRQQYPQFHHNVPGRNSGNPVFPTATLGNFFSFRGFNISPTRWPLAPGDWKSFLETDSAHVPQPAAAVDVHLAAGLANLTGLGPGEETNLAIRNLERGVQLGLPSGQAVATAMGVVPLTPSEVKGGSATVSDAMAAQTPLWFYILREGEVQQGGQRLGQVGSRIVAETFYGLLRADRNSYINQRMLCFKPKPIQIPREFEFIPPFPPPPIELEILTAAGPNAKKKEIAAAMAEAREAEFARPDLRAARIVDAIKVRWPLLCSWRPFLPSVVRRDFTLADLVNFANGVT